MFLKKTSTTMFLIILSVILPLNIYSQSDSIEGYYYYKGPRLMEIKVSGDTAITQLMGEREVWQKYEAEVKKQSMGGMEKFLNIMATLEHKGKLIDKTHIEFPTMDLTFDNFMKYAGAIGITDEEKEKAKKEFAVKYPGGSAGKFTESWELLPDGRLKIKSSHEISIFTFDGIIEINKLTDGNKDILKPTGNNELICGWKVKDNREVQAWQALDEGQYQKSAELFSAIAEAEKNNPFCCLGAVYAFIGLKDFNKARQALDGARSRLTNELKPFLNQQIYVLKDQIFTYETDASGKNLLALMDAIPDKEVPIDKVKTLYKANFREYSQSDFQKIGLMLDSFKYFQTIETAVQYNAVMVKLPLGQQSMTILNAFQKIPNFLKYQTLSKLLKMRGDYMKAYSPEFLESAFKQYGLSIALGQKFRHGFLIAHLIGIAMEAIGSTGFINAIEDGAVNNPQALASFKKYIDYFYENEPVYEKYEILCYELGHSQTTNSLWELIVSKIAVPNSLEADIRANVTRTKITLLKAAGIIKEQALKGGFPPTLPQQAALPDPFNDNNPIKYKSGGTSAIVYSVGPDKTDNGAMQIYDPKNGTKSAGDISITIK